MTALRLLLAAIGCALLAVGVDAFLESDPADLVDATWWLAGGVLVHDALLAPLLLGLVLLGAWVLPSWSHGAAAAGLVVLGTVTVLAVPVLGRFGASPSNPTLLDRDYGTGWLVFAALVVAASIGWAAVERQRAGRVRAPEAESSRSDMSNTNASRSDVSSANASRSDAASERAASPTHDRSDP